MEKLELGNLSFHFSLFLSIIFSFFILLWQKAKDNAIKLPWTIITPVLVLLVLVLNLFLAPNFKMMFFNIMMAIYVFLVSRLVLISPDI